jgi:hypothetical protein
MFGLLRNELTEVCNFVLDGFFSMGELLDAALEHAER